MGAREGGEGDWKVVEGETAEIRTREGMDWRNGGGGLLTEGHWTGGPGKREDKR